MLNCVLSSTTNYLLPQTNSQKNWKQEEGRKEKDPNYLLTSALVLNYAEKLKKCSNCLENKAAVIFVEPLLKSNNNSVSLFPCILLLFPLIIRVLKPHCKYFFYLWQQISPNFIKPKYTSLALLGDFCGCKFDVNSQK